jgi:hypothetical protein
LTAQILVFCLGVLYEVIYLAWTFAAVRGRPMLAALLSASVGALSVYGMTSVVHQPSLAWALILGYAVGSYLVVRYHPTST